MLRQLREGKPMINETDDGMEVVNKKFTDFLTPEIYGRFSCKKAVFAGAVITTIRIFVEKPVSHYFIRNCMEEKNSVREIQKTNHCSLNLAPIQTAWKNKEVYVYHTHCWT